MFKRRTQLLFSFLVICSMLIASCGGGVNTSPTGEVPATGPTALATDVGTEVPGTGMTAEPTGTMAVTGTETAPAAGEATATEGAPAGDVTPTAGATEGAAGPVEDMLTWTPEQIGGTVTVLAIWGGDELENFRAMIAPFEEQTGITVEVESTRDLAAVLNTRIQGGNPPDVAGLPNPGQLVTLAKAGDLLPLDDVLDVPAMEGLYDPGFIDLTRVDGKMYGIFTKAAVKSLIWYNPKQFEANGWEVPQTWDDLKALEQEIAATGVTPWCIGIEGGAGSAWPGTDWIEDIMLRTAGPEVYDQWWKHEIPWTDEAVENAFNEWGQIVNDPALTYGGAQTVISTNYGVAFAPMFEDQPGCYLHRQASFITTFFQEQFPELVAGEDYNFFVFPSIDEQHGNPLEVAGDLFGMFNDTPQARALLQYMVTAQAQTLWAERGGFLSANKAVDPSMYPDVITQQMGELISAADAVRFDASDLMPEGVSSQFSQLILQYVGAPDQLDSYLDQTEQIAVSEYQQTQ